MRIVILYTSLSSALTLRKRPGVYYLPRWGKMRHRHASLVIYPRGGPCG